jgi:hypothetical protein
LEKLKVDGAHSQKWKSFRQALNSVKSADEIEQLCTRLDRFRAQIDTTLLFILRHKIDKIEEKQEMSSAEISKSVLGSISHNKQWQADIIKSIHQQKWDHRDGSNVQEFSALFSLCTDSERKRFIENDILNRLYYQAIADRYERIPQAYQNTFEWVFHEPTVSNDKTSFDSYLGWLRGHEPVYWVTGKPGAGKSTLMKYMYTEPRTRQHATYWSGNAELITAGFYFWNSGTELQMSREGLLQTLLYQIVKRDRGLIPLAFHESWQNYELLGGDVQDTWRWPDLVKFFKTLISDDKRRFLFFIDGLDEFAGDHTELVNFILEISQFRNVKICVASRPWLKFEEAFGKRPRLKVEILTRPDIIRFVSETLRATPRYLALELDEPSHAKLLLDEVIGKAQGVFLWVRLVVRSLQEGLRDGDTMKDLLARISVLPSDLEALFRKILDRLDTDYFSQASILFQLMNAAVPRPLTVLSLAFAEDGFDCALEAEIKPLDEEQFRFRAESVRRRLNSRSKGLLEATPVKSHPERAHVQYLHRTVKDFLARRDIWTYITSGTDPSFNASVTLCGIYLLQLKTAHVSEQELIWDNVRGCLDHACRAAEVLGRKQIRLIDEMDRTATRMLKDAKDPGWGVPYTINHWTDTLVEHLQGDQDCRSWLDSYPCASFVEFAACSGLNSYVENKVSTKAISRNHILNGRTLLCLATGRKDIDLIQYLLTQKADPNLSGSQGISAWQQLLQSVESSYCTDTETWYKLVTLFLNHGADPEAIVHGLPAFQIIEIAFAGWDLGRTKQLLLDMLKRRKRLRKRKDWPSNIFKQQEARYLRSTTTLKMNDRTAFGLPDWLNS